MNVLISCSKLKSVTAGPAREVYIGPLTRLGLEYANRKGYEAWIISGHYGVIRPDFVIEPYDERRGSPLEAEEYPAGGGVWIGDSKYFSLAPERYKRLLPYSYNQSYGQQKSLMRELIDAG